MYNVCINSSLMIFDFLEVPWGLGRLPWGSQGGGPGPKLQGPIRANPGYRHFTFASKLMSILMSILGRFGIDLGSLLGVIFATLCTFCGPNWSRNRLRTVLSSKK